MRKNELTKKSRASRAAVAAVLALLFAGSAVTVVASALSVEVSALSIYAAALAASLLCAVGAVSGAGAAVAALAFVAVAGLYAASHASGFRALSALPDAWAGREVDAERVALGAHTLMTCGAFTLGAFFFALLGSRELAPTAIMALLAVLVACHAMSDKASMAAAAPGLIAAAAAFAMTGGIQRELPGLRALVPAALAVALAFMLTPAGRVTWPPLEDAANRVRSAFEQYFRFTRERVAFSISEQGYDHAGAVGDAVISMLGGPAEPHTDPVMRVNAGSDALLRGAIRTAYTGYSWVDAAPKSRYLYHDPTRRAIRERVFTPTAALKGALADADISVEMLDAGTSTLFVPGYLERFDMTLATAVYYNTAGEMFLTRDVRPGDSYRLRARLPILGDALREAVIRNANADDPRWAEIIATHTDLPAGIEGGVYTLTAGVIRNADNDFDRAVAIMDYLRANMRYTLRPDMPPRNRDFVSHFLLDTKEGYCSYYATAMAVMGRIAGLPTRYVEGYLARSGENVLTGEDAHAWAEVYFRGVGWIPFDATGGTTARGSGSGEALDDGTANGDGDEAEQGGHEAEGELGGQPDVPTPSPEPQPDEPDAPTPEPQSEAPQEQPEDAPEPEAPPEGAETPAGGGGAWWLALMALILIAMLALFVRWTAKRLRASDPGRLCARAKSAHQAALVLYRANLTLLSCMGQAPAGGEAPRAFADRVSARLKNPDYAAFVSAVTDAEYARRPLRADDVNAGLRAYARFRAALTRRERLCFALTRIARGLGDFEAIP